MRLLVTLVALLATWTIIVAQESAAADDPPKIDEPFIELDFSTVPREIAVQPKYNAEPRYALFCFGQSGEARMWAVVDKSDKENEYYDVLYFDLDADGDLTDADEKFTAKYQAEELKRGTAIQLNIPEIRVPGTGVVHKAFRVCTVPKDSRKGFWFSLKYRGELHVDGGYGPAGTDNTEWATQIVDAPIFRPTTEGRFAFALYAWGPDHVTLTIGLESNVYIIVGNPGGGPNTLCAVDETFLDLKANELTATVIAKGADGKEIKSEKTRITQHC